MADVLAALRRPGAGAEEPAKAVRYLSERRGLMRYAEYPRAACRSDRGASRRHDYWEHRHRQAA